MNLNIMHVHLQRGLVLDWFSHLSLWDLHCSRWRLWRLSHPVASSSLRLCPPAASSVWLAPPVQQRTTVRRFPPHRRYPTQPPQPNSTLQTNHNTKGSQMLTWRTGTLATPAHVRGELSALTSGRIEVKSNTEGIIQKKIVLVNSKGIKHGDRHIKCRF